MESPGETELDLRPHGLSLESFELALRNWYQPNMIKADIKTPAVAPITPAAWFESRNDLF
jgi:hypothetical protein